MHETDDRVIYIKDLFFAVIYQWRWIMVAAIVVAILAAAFVGITSNQQTPPSMSQEDYLAAMEEYENKKQKIEGELASVAELITYQETYISESPLTQINPYNVYRATVDYTVFADPQIADQGEIQLPDYTSAILYAYSKVLYSDNVVETMAEKVGIHSKYIYELITIYNGGTGNHTISFSIVYHNEEGVRALLDVLLNTIEQTRVQLQERIGEHDLQMINCIVHTQIDNTFAQLQTDAAAKLSTLLETQATLTEELAALTPPVTVAQASNPNMSKKLAKAALLGACVGFFAVAAVACVLHIAGGKVYSARTLVNRTGVKVLGCMPSNKSKCSFDRWLRKLEGRCVDPEIAKTLAATMRSYSAGSTNILIAGNYNLTELPLLQEAMAETQLPYHAFGSLLDAPEAINKLSQCDAVIMLIQCGKCGYTQVLQELQIIRDRSNLLGCILIDG